VTRVAVLGAGSWGTAYSIVLADTGADVVLWARRPECRDAINDAHANPDYLPGVQLPAVVTATSDVGEALAGAELVVFAVPSQTLRANLTAWAHLLPPGAVLVSLMKGIELVTTLRMSEVLAEVSGAGPERIAVVSGPNLAREIAARQPSVSVIASRSEAVAEQLRKASGTSYFRTYYNQDVVGVELAGAVKNVIALAVGMAEGMGFGHNSQASIVTRGLAEMARLGVALGADVRTFSGLAGLGDLMATCSSPLSRNRGLGVQLGRGLSLAEVLATTSQVAEGVKTCESVLALARRHGVDVPITEHVARVVHDGLPPQQMVARLMEGSGSVEHEHD
jgi:glycerol-3-phosphate dehydrogenase (NAD(P)+)